MLHARPASVFAKNPDYWETGKPYVDELVIIDFPDDTARVNALLGGQVEAIDNLPAAQVASVKGNPNLRVLISQTGAWQPFTMRVDAAPFDDVKVRQAMRLIVDREQIPPALGDDPPIQHAAPAGLDGSQDGILARAAR